MNPALVPQLIGTLMIGGAGGWLLNLVNMPLAWMLGAMLTVAVLAAAGAPVKTSSKLRGLVLIVLGVAIGSTFSPGVLSEMPGWGLSLGIVAFYTATTAILGGMLIHWLTGWPMQTSYFSATPGGLTYMVIAGSELGGDEKTMATVHSLRIMITVLVIPMIFKLTQNVSGNVSAVVSSSWSGFSLKDIMWLTVAGLGGTTVAKAFRMPAFTLTGPLVASAIIHATGLTASRPPLDLVRAAQVVLGVSIGCRFAGINFRILASTLFAGIGYSLFLIAFSASLAAITMNFVDAGFESLWLAFAPGGVAEMVLMSLSLGLDPAFVSAHHLFRFMLVLLVATPMFGVCKWLIENLRRPPRTES